MKRKILNLLGCSGSIGQNCLQIVRQNSERFSISALSVHSQVDFLLEMVKEFKPQFAAVSGKEPDDSQKSAFADLGTQLFWGPGCLQQMVEEAEFDLLVNAIVGSAGFLPTLTALELKKDIALANKETLVIGGELVMESAARNDCSIYPIDSEHSAIFQCLMGEQPEAVEKIILTASGGPFRAMTQKEMANVTVEQALKHPNWDMGAKITIDSATMMNKGLEVIEARWLFGIPVEKIQVVVHPQSIIHSMVAFRDGSIKAQMGEPDMKVPIQLALTYPERIESDFPRLDFCKLSELTFELPDFEKFRALGIAFEAIKTGGTAPAVMNAANEAAVALFLSKKIGFVQIAESIESALNVQKIVHQPDRNELIKADKTARVYINAKFA